jgi:[protein-PII] uridylyltransferase
MSYAHAPALERRSRAPRAAPAPLKGVERGKLLAKLAVLHERLSDDPAAFRRAAVEMLRAALASARDEARRALEGGGTGRACAEALSAETDDLLHVALEMSARWLAPAERGQALPTIVAVGGYGRGMLAPFSDIDLLFLLPDKPKPGVEKVVEALLYVLWDLKQKVGHATRTVNECLRQARADMEVAAIAISATKRRRIARAARVWLARNPWAAGLTLRGDAIFVAPGRLPRHAPSAYRLMID